MYTNRKIWNVSYPIFLSLLAQNVINVTDTAFLGRVGEVELGASAMGGLYYICAFTIAFGFSTGSQIVIGRRNGEGRYDLIGPVMIQGVFFLFSLAAILFLFSRFFAGDVMRVLISSDAILNTTKEFLDWRVFGFFFSFVNVMFRALFYWHYPYKGTDIERSLDGNDKCPIGLSFDFRTCRIPKDGYSRGGYRFRHSRGGIDSLFRGLYETYRRYT